MALALLEPVPRRAICAVLGLFLLGAAGRARAGSYIDRAGLMIAEGSRSVLRQLGWSLPPSKA
jgi:hypothetical protein